MGFSKKKNPAEIAISAHHPYHPDVEFVFFMTKKPSKEALDAHSRYIGLADDELPEAFRAGLIETVGMLMTREPEGFDDFPQGPGEKRPLIERATEYFSDDPQGELEAIMAKVWRAYMGAAVPAAYLKSLQGDGAGDGGVRPGALVPRS